MLTIAIKTKENIILNAAKNTAKSIFITCQSMYPATNAMATEIKFFIRFLPIIALQYNKKRSDLIRPFFKHLLIL